MASILVPNQKHNRIGNFLYLVSTDFEILKHKARKQLVFPTTPLFDVLLTKNTLEFLDKTYH